MVIALPHVLPRRRSHHRLCKIPFCKQEAPGKMQMLALQLTLTDLGVSMASNHRKLDPHLARMADWQTLLRFSRISPR